MSNTLLLNQANPKAKPIFKKLVDYANSKGYQVVVTGCYYSYEKGLELNKIDSRNPVWSYHTFGLAVDLNLFKPSAGEKLQKASSKELWLNCGLPQYAKSIGLRWGGDFSTYYDPIHFDLGNNYSIDTLKSKLIAQQGSVTENWKPNQILL